MKSGESFQIFLDLAEQEEDDPGVYLKMAAYEFSISKNSHGRIPELTVFLPEYIQNAIAEIVAERKAART
jgi:hypothetical protein